jgi:hypothetical protein
MFTYYQKYLKYKSKYDLLKSQFGGRTVIVHDKYKPDQLFEIELDKGDDITVLKAQMLTKLSDKTLSEDNIDIYPYNKTYCSASKINGITDETNEVCIDIKQKPNVVNFIPQRITSGFGFSDIGIKERTGKFALNKFVIFEGIIHSGKMNPDQFVYITKGTGKVITTDGDVYIGKFYNNYLLGQGKIIYSNGDVKEGEFIDGLLNGQGKIIYSDGGIDEGEFLNGSLNGQAKVTYPNYSSTLEGTFENGKFIKGTITNTAMIQTGDFVGNELVNGKKIFTESGNYVEGEFHHGNLIKGTKVQKGVQIKKGSFVNNKLNGEGSILNLIDDILYTGIFIDDKLKHGSMKVPIKKSTPISNSNKKIKDYILYHGYFENDLLHGKGKITFEDGRVEEGEYYHGSIIKKK